MTVLDHPELAFFAPWPGVVVDNVDPDGLHRVKIRIDGLIEPSTDWAFPLTGAGGGSAQRGAHVVPAINATVVVQFLGGDPERPVYQPAWWGRVQTSESPNRDQYKSEMPGDADAAGAEAHQVQVIELEGISITVDERGGKRLLAIYDRELRERAAADTELAALGVGDPIIEYDIEGKGLTLSSLSAVVIKSKGIVTIDGLEVHVNGKLALDNGKAF